MLLSELPGGDGGVYLKKLASGGTRVEPVDVGGSSGLWVSGLPHVTFFAGRSPRLAGNVLLWAAAGATYRLEGPNIRKEDAISLALITPKGVNRTRRFPEDLG